MDNIKIGIRSVVGIILGIMILVMSINIILLYPTIGAIGIFTLIVTIYLYLSLASKIGKTIKKIEEQKDGKFKS